MSLTLEEYLKLDRKQRYNLRTYNPEKLININEKELKQKRGRKPVPIISKLLTEIFDIIIYYLNNVKDIINLLSSCKIFRGYIVSKNYLFSRLINQDFLLNFGIEPPETIIQNSYYKYIMLHKFKFLYYHNKGLLCRECNIKFMQKIIKRDCVGNREKEIKYILKQYTGQQNLYYCSNCTNCYDSNYIRIF